MTIIDSHFDVTVQTNSIGPFITYVVRVLGEEAGTITPRVTVDNPHTSYWISETESFPTFKQAQNAILRNAGFEVA